jgi:hypothetical protein
VKLTFWDISVKLFGRGMRMAYSGRDHGSRKQSAGKNNV